MNTRKLIEIQEEIRNLKNAGANDTLKQSAPGWISELIDALLEKEEE